MSWKRVRRGWSDIHIHPDIDGAVVDGRGFGLNPGVRHKGMSYSSVAEAKRKLERENLNHKPTS